MSEYPTATVREIDGQIVLDDPQALAIIRAIEKHNCGATLALNADRVIHFKKRIRDLGKTVQEVCIVILNVDDHNGGMLADILMPGYDWDAIRAQGQIPFARGLTSRDTLQKGLVILDPEAGKKLEEAKGVAVVVMDHGVVEVFESPLDDTNVWSKIVLDPPV